MATVVTGQGRSVLGELGFRMRELTLEEGSGLHNSFHMMVKGTLVPFMFRDLGPRCL